MSTLGSLNSPPGPRHPRSAPAGLRPSQFSVAGHRAQINPHASDSTSPTFTEAHDGRKAADWYALTIALAGAAVVGSAARSTREVMNAGMAVGTPDLKSAGVMTFGPDNMLFLGDSLGGAVFAVDVADSSRDATTGDFEVTQIDRKIAALLGTTPDDIVIRDLATHKPSQHIYLSVSRGRGSDATPALIRVSRGGELAEVGLTQARFAKATLQDMPATDAKTSWGESARGMAITDLAVEGGELFVAGLSNEQFSSALRRVPVPFSSNARTTTLEIFHTSHNKYETNAPIETLLPMTVRNKRVMLAGYGCSPLALFGVDDIRREKHLRGIDVGRAGRREPAERHGRIRAQWRSRRHRRQQRSHADADHRQGSGQVGTADARRVAGL